MSFLSVYLCNEYVGLLSCDKQGRFSFQYDPQWISRKDVPPLSVSLPLQEQPYLDEKARPFFTNLLPESFLREAVAKKLGISFRNDFGLLEALGGECAGAVTILPQNSRLEKIGEYRELSSDEFHALIRELPQRPLLAGEEGIRLSLAGAQNKLPIYLDGERVFLPTGASPSSHIVKTGIAGFEQSVHNEAFCMTLAEKVGLHVPRVRVLTIPEPIYVVDRYDRSRDENGTLCRLHQEDFCQALGITAENKYESEGGPSLADCFTVLDRFSTSPALDKKSLLEWVVFNYLIHNADAHAKNISLTLSTGEIRLAPFYDLMCTGVYEGLNKKFAMKIGKENRSQWIQPRHWERMAGEIGIGAKFVLKTLNEMTDRVRKAAEVAGTKKRDIWKSSSIIERIIGVIKVQAKRTTL
jgi:serine/threonine-protein kinase HipA